MKKLFMSLSTASIIAIPVISIVSCSKEEHKVSFRKHEYFVSKEIQDSSARKHIILDNIVKSQLTSIPTNLNSFYHSKIIYGGYQEERKYYISKIGQKANTTIHAGEDVLLPYRTKIVSPVNGNIIASYWLKNKNNQIAEGIGGVVIIKTKIKDLNVPEWYKENIYLKNGKRIYKTTKMVFIKNDVFLKPKKETVATKDEYIKYLSTLNETKRKEQKSEEDIILLTFMHLSRDTVKLFGKTKNFDDKRHLIELNTDVDFSREKHISKGETIGFVGSLSENGGWAPHVHLEVHSFAPFSLTTRMHRYSTVSSNKHLSHSYAILKPTGTFAFISQRQREKYNIEGANSFFANKGIIDPNNIYSLHSKTEKKIKIF